MDLAHVLPLGEAALRHELFLELDRRGLADDARRERDLIIRTGPFLSWHVSDALRRTADEAYEARDFGRAADLWDRAFLNNQRTDTVFSEPWANFAMPALMHRCRAMALIGAGKLKEASAEADLCLLYSPGETDALIDFVTELDRLGHKPEADALYARATAPYRQLCKEFPNSAQLHNQFAWAACKCRRDLDEALAHARRAAELEPTSTAILDTLAETHYQRGEVPSAIEAMNKCVELEPKVQRHREQLERFKKGSP
jgi:tetratricopeptide (TPR) repeat protein